MANKSNEDVFSVLSMDILTGRLAPGSKLTEVNIAARFGVSRTPIREALMALEQVGWVERQRNKGFVVSRLAGDEIAELYPILWTLESLALTLSWDDVKPLAGELRKKNEEFSRSTEDPIKAIEIDAQWHRLLISKCANKRLLEQVEKNRMALERYEYLGTDTTRSLEKSVEQHNDIIDAIEWNDQVAASNGIQANWTSALRTLLQIHSEQGSAW